MTFKRNCAPTGLRGRCVLPGTPGQLSCPCVSAQRPETGGCVPRECVCQAKVSPVFGTGGLSSRPAVTALDAAEPAWKDRGGGRGGAVPTYTPGRAWEAPAAGHRGATFTRALRP